MDKLTIKGLVLLLSFIFSPVFADQVTLLEGATFVRGKGSPITESKTFTGSTVNGSFSMRIYNGGPDHSQTRVAAANIWVNGELIVSEFEFSQQVTLLERDVPLLDTNLLQVELKGTPQGTITINIGGEIENRVPIITSTAVTSAAEDAIYLYQVMATDEDALNTLSFELSQSPNGMTIDASTGLINWMPEQRDVGEHSVTVIAIDPEQGQATQSYQLSVANTNDKPVITSTALTSTNEDELYQYQVLATDEDIDDQLTYGLLQHPEGMNIDPQGGLISWLPAQVDVGLHLIELSVTDQLGESDNQHFQLSVININDAPVLAEVAPQTVKATETLSFQLNASDEDGDSLQFSLLDAPDGAEVDAQTAWFSWTPSTEQLGEYQITVSVTDGELDDSLPFTVTVEPPPYDPPAFLDEEQLIAFAGQPLSHLVQVQSEVEFRLELMSGPTGLVLSEQSGEISWLEPVVGTYEITVHAKITEEIFTARTYRLEVLDKASSNAGDDFWLVFSSNTPGNRRLYLSSEFDTQGQIAIPLKNYSLDFTVAAGQVTVVEIPEWLTNPSPQSQIVGDNGIHVTSDRDITLYALNHAPQSTDGFLVLPTDTLGQHHRAMTYGDDQLSVVATADATQVSITFVQDMKIETGRQVLAGETIDIELNSGQSFNLKRWDSGNLAGSAIDSNKPVAVFSGARCTFVPLAVQACDHLVEQLLPVKYWGQEYHTVPFANRFRGDLFQVVAAFDNTRVEINGEYLLTLNAGEWLNDTLEAPSVITANHPIQVAQFSLGAQIDADKNGNYGDPFMLMLTPSSQSVGKYIVSTTNLGIIDNFVNIAIDQRAVATLSMDGEQLDPTIFSPIPGTQMLAAQVRLDEGTHILTAATDFAANIYGFDNYYNSYGYQGGVNLPRYNDQTQISVQSNATTLPVGLPLCLDIKIGDQQQALQKARLDLYSNNAPEDIYHLYTNALGEVKHCHYSLNPGTDNIVISSGKVSQQLNITWLAAAGEGGNAPTIVSAPNTSVQAAKAYQYQLIAVDADAGETLSYSLLDGPAGMDMVNGLVSWQPLLSDIGEHKITLQVTDREGLTTEQSYTLKVYLGNQAPVLVNPPQDKLVYVGRSYTQQLSIADPDDHTSFCQLISSPLYGSQNGKVAYASTHGTANSCRDLLRINVLTEEQIGIHPITIRLWDRAGGESFHQFQLEVKKNNLPQVTAHPAQFAKVGVEYRTALIMSDPDGDSLSYRISAKKYDDGSFASLPLTINELTGELVLQPTAEHVGRYNITLSIRDADDTLTYTYPLTVSLADEPLTAQLQIEPKFINAGEAVTLVAQASGGTGAVNFELQVNGLPVSLDQSQSATFSGTQESGVYQVQLRATDDAGSFYQITDYFVVRVDEGDGDGGTPGDPGDPGEPGDPGDPGDPGVSDPDYPEVEILHLEQSELITAPKQIQVRAYDANMVEWRLSLVSESNQQLLASGHANVEGVVASFDPTLLVNGQYDLQLYAVDINGQAVQTRVPVLVDGNLKVGHFTYSVEELNIPLAGIPISVTRTYDSRRKHELGDFGYGWHLDYKLVDLDVSRPLGTAWTMVESQRYIGPVPIPVYCLQSNGQILVTVTLPNDEVETFKATAEPGCTDYFPTNEVHLSFAPTGDTTSKLALKNNTQVRFVNGNLVILGQDGVFDSKAFVLTTRSGYQYHIHADTGVSLINDPNGHSLTFDANGIHHSAGKSIAFSRDSKGKITQIRRPDGLSGLLRYHYFSYDGAHRLTKRIVDNIAGQEDYAYDYRNTLTDIKDADNRRKLFNIYDDDGRLIAQEDNEGNRTTFDHNIEGRQSVVTDRNGNTTFYYYDQRGNVTSKVDALGHISSFTYDGNDNLLTETDPLGNVSRRTYNAKNDLLTLTDAQGNTTTYSYNDLGQELTITDANGNLFTNSYDAVGNLLSVSDPLGNVAGNNINAMGLVSLTEDPLGHQTHYEYDSLGNKTKMTDASGTISRYQYDAANRQTRREFSRTLANGSVTLDVETTTYERLGNIASVTDNKGQVESYTYDKFGYLEKQSQYYVSTSYTRDAYGRVLSESVAAAGGVQLVTAFEYDAEGNKTAETDPNGQRTEYEYDALNRLVKTRYPDGSQIAMDYDAAGRITSETDENGAITQYQYDKVGRRTQITDALGNISRFEYDPAGNLIKEIDALGRETRYEYDSMDRRIAVIYADSRQTAESHDALGRNIGKTDQLNRQTSYEYDPMGRLSKVIDALGNETSYQYDEAGNKIAQTDALGRTTSWEYDARGNVTARVLPLGQRETFVYDGANNLTSHTDFNGNTTNYTYQAPNRLVQARYADGSADYYSYDDNGNRLSVRNTITGTWSYDYDSRNRLTKETQPDGTVLEYGYDAAGNKTSLTTTYANGDSRTELYAYDSLNRLIAVTDHQSQTTRFDYDAVGNQTHIHYPNGLVAEYSYDSLNRVTSVVTKDADGNLLTSYAYALDATGRRTGLTELDGRSSQWSYDEVYRLTDEVIADPINGDHSSSYLYDKVGNRTQRTVNGIVTDYVYDDNDRLITSTEDGLETGFEYDPQGNLLEENDGSTAQTYSYNAQHKLTGFSDGTNSLSYQYNTDGIRIAKTLNGNKTRYLIDSNRDYAQVIGELDSTNTLLKAYLYGMDLIAQEQEGDWRFYHYDSLGTTRDLSDNSGQLTDSYDYEAFGELLGREGETDNQYLYTGEQYDPELDNYYLRARYYDQGAGRFTQMDAWRGCSYTPQGLNKYIYSESDPLNKIDPSGYFASSLSEVSISNSINTTLTTMSAAVIGVSAGTIGSSILYGDYISRNNNLVWNMDHSLSSKEVKEKSAERKAYKRRCTEPKPPGLSGCDSLRWLLKRNQDCKEMRENFAKKWYGDNEANHVGEIKNLEVAIDKLLKDIERFCK
ncbi:putative Ig domain-containing protein [Aliiglaciecola sp. CAU 1673]|uniref:putative Ig domain-containing protein n=1 Tax=Aliiglaciecola sp. CAU 1673 TaxID=3032595 RepID=UPI0023DC1311|nr:putative Ig domain-containing protein [Aliiglaciecola sp. CAU 1673]MDF2179906.1 putative Ig domain-containing protein [Aliiglaciecola sp. CAU 1673]